MSQDRDKVILSLRIKHPTEDPTAISRSLGIDPITSWRAGTPRETPAGERLDGEHRFTYWSSTVATGPGDELPVLLKDVLQGLVSHREYLQELTDTGGAAEVFVGWFFDASSGAVLTSAVLAELGELRLDLSLDLYGSQPHDPPLDGTRPV
jgi:uncharacterized protein DUF4279